jgi:DNA polymerase III delta prime subunit
MIEAAKRTCYFIVVVSYKPVEPMFIVSITQTIFSVFVSKVEQTCRIRFARVEMSMSFLIPLYIKKTLNALARIISHTTLVELCNAFIELQRLYLEVLSFIYDLPGKKITPFIIDQIVSTMRDRWGINIPNTSELEMLEVTDEKTIREMMGLLELNEEKIREVIKKYLKAIREAVEFTLEIFKQKHYPEHVGEYFDEIEEIFVNKVRKYGEHHKRLLEKAIETIYRTPG